MKTGFKGKAVILIMVLALSLTGCTLGESGKYKYYIEKQDKRVEKLHKMENARIPADFDYGSIPSLSAESRNKLEAIRPVTLGQANRISGIRNSDIMLLMVYLKR